MFCPCRTCPIPITGPQNPAEVLILGGPQSLGTLKMPSTRISSHSSHCSLGDDRVWGGIGIGARRPLMGVGGSDQHFPKWGMCEKFLTGAKHMSSCVHSRGLNIETSINHPNCLGDEVQALQDPRKPLLSGDCLVSDRLNFQWVLGEHSCSPQVSSGSLLDPSPFDCAPLLHSAGSPCIPVWHTHLHRGSQDDRGPGNIHLTPRKPACL